MSIEPYKEHQHGHGVADDGAQAQVGKDEGHEAEHDGPDPVRGPLGEEADEGLATAGDEGHGHVVHAVKAQVLQKRRSGTLPRPGHAGNNNKFHPFAPLIGLFDSAIPYQWVQQDVPVTFLAGPNMSENLPFF